MYICLGYGTQEEFEVNPKYLCEHGLPESDADDLIFNC